MNALRILRNIATLFILGAALLASRPTVGLPQISTAASKFCSLKVGFNCILTTTKDHCTESRCRTGQPCSDSGCRTF
jgi:hypothetical protein